MRGAELTAEGEQGEQRRWDFVSFVSHELKNPLTSIRGFAQQMRRRGEYSAEALDVILVQADRLDRLIDDLLDVSRLEAGRLRLRPRDVDLNVLVGQAVEQARALTRLHALTVVSNGPVVGRWDADRLEQVMQNLLSNAIKYSPDGGEVLVEVGRREDEARVTVSDEGIGIEPDQLERVFERFYRAEDERAHGAQGMGIGLYVTRALVEAHGGRIWAESEAGRGSTFGFTLPLTVPLKGGA